MRRNERCEELRTLAGSLSLFFNQYTRFGYLNFDENIDKIVEFS